MVAARQFSGKMFLNQQVILSIYTNKVGAEVLPECLFTVY